MLYTNKILINKYDSLKSPSDKITREIKQSHLYRINRGLYEDDINSNRFYIANLVYGPSYISFESALGYYGMIPEEVKGVSSATFQKRKTKIFKNSFGIFEFRDIPSSVYPYGIIIKESDEPFKPFMIASKEKALCDILYISPTAKNIEQLKYLIFEDLRIDEEIYESLNKKDLIFLAEKYPGINLRLFKQLLMEK